MSAGELELGDIAAAGAVDDEGTRRDQWGRYLLFGQPFTRVSTILDELDNKASLAPWHAAMAIGGLFVDVELMAKARDLWLEHGGDPWYAGAAAKKAAKVIVEAAHKRGGGREAAAEGHNVHALSATLDTGGSPVCPTPHHEAWLEGYVNGLARAGITIDPEYVERIVVLDAIGAAGMFDRGRCFVPGFKKPLLGDLKSGTTLEWSQHSIPMQVGAYTHADAMVEQGAAADGSEDRRLPMPPDISLEHALIIHAPFDRPGEVNLWVVRADEGWDAFQLAAAARSWHQGPGGAWDQLPGELERQLEESIAAIEERPDAQLRAWLQQRIDTIGQHPQARQRLPIAWPKDVPPLRASDGHTPEQLAVVEAVLDDIEARYSMPFGPSRPGDAAKGATDWMDRLHAVFPNSTEQGAQEP